jgi:transposase
VGVSVNTARKYVRQERPPPSPARAVRATKLDAFKEYLGARVAAARPDWIPATVLCREIRERGYAGGETRVRAFLRTLKPTVAEEPLIRFETLPGEQMQVDWASFQGGRLHAFVATLGFSRATYVEFTVSERLEVLLACHSNALIFFGGVPRQVLYDNMKTVVIAREVYGRGQHRFQPGFLDFARHCGFVPRLCRPYRAKTKGKVERFIHYLRRSFYVPLAARLKVAGLTLDAATANAEVWRWLNEVANRRRHGTTQEVPAERLILERPQLQPLPATYPGIPARQAPARTAPKVIVPVESLQHPLSVYDQLLPEVAR